MVKRAEKVKPASTGVAMVATAVAGAAVPVMGGGRDEVVLEGPRVQSQYDSSAAVTDVALFSVCPRKYFLARYVGLQAEAEGQGTGAPEGRGIKAVEFGIEVHQAMAGMETSSAEALELKLRFDASPMGRRLAGAGRVEREFDFMLTVEDVVVSGKIDAWFQEKPEEGGELVVLDYKTDRDDASAEEYGLQLRLYALALERYTGRLPDRAALCYLRPGRIVEVSLTGAELERVRETVRELAAAQSEMKFPLKVGEQCRRCWFYGGLCPAKLEGGLEGGVNG